MFAGSLLTDARSDSLQFVAGIEPKCGALVPLALHRQTGEPLRWLRGLVGDAFEKSLGLAVLVEWKLADTIFQFRLHLIS